MKFVLTPDSLKGSLSAWDVCQSMQRACQRVFPGCECVLLPGGDGGEGTLDALHIAWGKDSAFVPVPVRGLQGDRITAPILLCGCKAAVESAQAAGLPPITETKRILTADSFGVGQMILHALDMGARELIITLGGNEITYNIRK